MVNNTIETSCAHGDTICHAHCTPDTAAQLQPIPYVPEGAMNIY